MPLTNAEKQRRYRERHLGPDGERHRLLVDISAVAAAQLKRLARHNGFTVTKMIEGLAAKADSDARAGMTDYARRKYLREG